MIWFDLWFWFKRFFRNDFDFDWNLFFKWFWQHCCCNCFFYYSSPKNCISFIVSFSHLIWSFIWFVFFQYKDCWQQFFLTIVCVGRKRWGRKDKKMMIFPAPLQQKFWGRKSCGRIDYVPKKTVVSILNYSSNETRII